MSILVATKGRTPLFEPVLFGSYARTGCMTMHSSMEVGL